MCECSALSIRKRGAWPKNREESASEAERKSCTNGRVVLPWSRKNLACFSEEKNICVF